MFTCTTPPAPASHGRRPVAAPFPVELSAPPQLPAHHLPAPQSSASAVSLVLVTGPDVSASRLSLRSVARALRGCAPGSEVLVTAASVEGYRDVTEGVLGGVPVIVPGGGLTDAVLAAQRTAARPLVAVVVAGEEVDLPLLRDSAAAAGAAPEMHLVGREPEASTGAGVAVVLCAAGRTQGTLLTLLSLEEHQSANVATYDVVLVDDGSDAETSELLNAVTGDVVVVDGSRGGAGTGISRALDRYPHDRVLLLEPGVLVHGDWLDRLCAELDRQPHAAAVRAQVLVDDGAGAVVPVRRLGVCTLVHRPFELDDLAVWWSAGRLDEGIAGTALDAAGFSVVAHDVLLSAPSGLVPPEEVSAGTSVEREGVQVRHPVSFVVRCSEDPVAVIATLESVAETERRCPDWNTEVVLVGGPFVPWALLSQVVGGDVTTVQLEAGEGDELVRGVLAARASRCAVVEAGEVVDLDRFGSLMATGPDRFAVAAVGRPA